MSSRFTLPPRYTLGSSKSFENDSDSSRYHCHYCSTQNSHGGDNSEALFECEICSKKFRQLSTYTRHKKMHSPEEKVFICLLCPHTCESELSMRTHVTEAHAPTEDFYVRTDKTHKRKEVEKDLRNQYICQICLKSFRKKCHLFNHIRCHTPKLKCEKRVGSSSKQQFLYRNSTLQQPPQKEECAKDVCEPNQINGFQKSGIADSYNSSIVHANFWPRVVLSSHLNLLLSRWIEE